MKPVKTTVRGVEKWMIDLRKYKQGRKFFPTEEAAKAWWRDYEKKTFKEGPTLAKMDPAERADMLAFWWRMKEAKLNPEDLFAAASLRSVKSPLLVDAFEECAKAKLAAGKTKDYVRVLRYTFKRFGSAHKSLKVCEVETTHIERWLAGRKKSPKTIKNDIGNLSIFFRLAIRRRWREVNPCDALERVTVIPPEPGILRVKAAEKLMRVCYDLDRPLCRWFALSLFMGIRVDELKRMKSLDQSWFNKGMLEINSHVSKTHTRRLVDIPENVKEWLTVSSEWPIKNWKRRYDGIRVQSELIQNWPHNVLRHSAASYMLALNNDAAKTSLQLGNSVSILMKHYRALVTQDDAVAFYAICPPPTRQIV